MPPEQMQEIGAQAFQEVKSAHPAMRDSKTQTYATCVARAILAAAPEELGAAEQWEVVVFDDPAVNAFALPGGKVGIYRGMIEFSASPAELAAVVGHEIGHVLAEHGNERVSEAFAAQGIAAVLSAVVQGGARKDLLFGAIGLGYTVGVALPHSRTQEREADTIGLELMARSGFDPAGAVALWQRMAEREGQRPPEFLSTHPAPAARAEALTGRLAEARRLYETAIRERRPPGCSAPVAPVARAR